MASVDLRVDMDAGRATRASAAARVDAPVERVWDVIYDVEKFPERVPMIHKVHVDRTKGRATVQLKFKLALFSVGFEFVVDVRSEKERWLELAWVSGEPRGIKLRLDLEPLEDGRATMLRSTGAFDVMSLGWLAKYFLKHHPEIQFGVLPGVALGLLESMRRAAES